MELDTQHLLFDLSGIPEEKLPYISILQSVLGIINTKNYEYSELFNEINVHTGGIGTSLELYTDVTKVKEKEFRATFEIKGKALYPKMDVLFSMMREILMESDLGDEKRLKEILSNVEIQTADVLPVIRTYDSSPSFPVLYFTDGEVQG